MICDQLNKIYGKRNSSRNWENTLEILVAKWHQLTEELPNSLDQQFAKWHGGNGFALIVGYVNEMMISQDYRDGKLSAAQHSASSRHCFAALSLPSW